MAAVSHGHAPSRLGAAVDVVSDACVVAFAWWTLLTYVATLTRWPVLPVVVIWLLGLPVIGVAAWRWRWRRDADADAPADDDGESPAARAGDGRPFGWPFVVLVVLAVIAAVVVAWLRQDLWWVGWTCAVLATATAVVLELRRSRPRPRLLPRIAPASPVQRLGQDAIALATAVGCGVFSLFVLRVDFDDVYYVNRSTFVAQVGRIPFRDVLLSNHHLKPVGGTGAPVDALGPMTGAIARLLDIQAPSVSWLVVPPIAVALAVWAVWRLIRSWCPVAPFAAFAVTIAFYLLSSETHLAFGNMWLTRAWQGKIVFFTWLIPTMLVILTRFVRMPSVPDGVLLYAAGVAAIGLTITATIDAPAIAAAGVAVFAVERRWRLAAAVAGSAVFPFVVGFVGAKWAPVGAGQISNLATPSTVAFDVLTSGVVALLGGLGLWLGHRFLVDRVARGIALTLTAIVTVMLGPHVMYTLRDILGPGGVLRRVLYIAPLPILAGVVVAVVGHGIGTRLKGRGYQLAVATVALAAIGGMIATSGPIWSYDRTYVVGHPTWKVVPEWRGSALALARHTAGREVVLAPPPVMALLTEITAHARAVDPRTPYTELIPQPAAELAQRKVLTRFASFGPGRVDLTRVTQALVDLDVSVVCAKRDRIQSQAFVRGLGYQHQFGTPRLECFRKSSAG